MTPTDIAQSVLARDTHGRLTLTEPDGQRHEGVVPVRAFPISAPDDGLSLVSSDGHELAWIDHIGMLQPAQRQLIEEELALREFTPTILRITDVSTFSTPSTWSVDTDRGPVTLVLKVEEDIRRLPQRGRLLITSGHGIVFLVPDLTALDRHSKRLLERFL